MNKKPKQSVPYKNNPLTFQALPKGCRVIRILPNLPVEVCAGACAVAPGPEATPGDVKMLLELLRPCGHVEQVTEPQLEVCSSVLASMYVSSSLYYDEHRNVYQIINWTGLVIWEIGLLSQKCCHQVTYISHHVVRDHLAAQGETSQSFHQTDLTHNIFIFV